MISPLRPFSRTKPEPVLGPAKPDPGDADRLILALKARSIKPVIPPKANRLVKRDCDFALYCERNLVERFFNTLKHFRAIATRYDKLARNFLAAVHLVALTILLN